MFQTSYSRVGTFTRCPMKYALRYIDQFETPFNCDAANPLTIGTMLHESIELGVDAAVRNYVAKYPVLTDAMINEIIKMRVLGARASEAVFGCCDGEKPIFEQKISCNGFVGYIDCLIPVGGHRYKMLDFKYSNAVDRYLESSQLSIYKYFFEREYTGDIIDSMEFMIVPKTMIRQKQTEDIYQFRKRLVSTLDEMGPRFYRVDYDPAAVADFLVDTMGMINAKDFLQFESRLCDWCDYKELCLKGNDMLVLPKNERREETAIMDPDMWIYADSYVGKSTFVDHLDNVLFINTDGNVSNITSPYIPIADELLREGRMTTKVFAWAKFREVLDELEKHDNTFEVIALDLVEDLYEHCRFYVFDRLGIKHESDGAYGKGWDMVRTEFLSQMKRLKSLGYRTIYISKEIVNEITYANGMKVSTFKPNIPDKIANVLAGTVTVTLRAYMDERGHFLQLRKNENVFGGGRIKFNQDRCDLTVEAFDEALRAAQGGSKPANKTKRRAAAVETKETAVEATEVESKAQIDGEADVDAAEAAQQEEKPKRRTRKRRTAE